MVKQVAADVCLAGAVFLVLTSSLGVLLMRTPVDKVHFVTPVTVVAPILVAMAVIIRMGWYENSAMTWLALFFMTATGPFLSHATVRAMRIREAGDWRPGKGGTPGQGRAKDRG
jgi:multisubunit Na+/H+ antiporter MnhG subunit